MPLRPPVRIAAAILLGALLSGPVSAKPLKWASQDDAVTMDPHAFNHGMTMTVLNHIYEGLVRRNRDMQVEPALAVSWTQPSPTVWRFQLRDGVVFHDGTPLIAEDVVFSVKRALSPESDMKVFAASITDVRAVDKGTVDVVTSFPNAALLQSLPEVRILSKPWAEANGAAAPAELKKGQENFATRNANGTGPFKLVSREPEVRTVLAANERWWDKPTHNVTEATLVRIASDATRVAALLSGEVDFAFPIPLQDIDRVNATSGLKVLQGPEIRTMFLAWDMARDELLYSSVKGKNPFKDRRVRQALYQAVDVEAISARLMRKTAVPTGNMIAPGLNGVDPSLQPRAFPYDLEAARRLMAEAGYADGFEVTLDCPNDRYVNDEQVCQAIAAMLARIKVKVSVNAMPASKFFTKVGGRDTSLCFFGYTPVNLDAYNTLNVMMATPDGKAGQWNVGNYSNPALDKLMGEALSELDPARRTKLLTEAFTLHRTDIGHLPLYQQGLSWGAKATLDVALQSDNRVNLRFFTIR